MLANSARPTRVISLKLLNIALNEVGLFTNSTQKGIKCRKTIYNLTHCVCPLPPQPRLVPDRAQNSAARELFALADGKCRLIDMNEFDHRLYVFVFCYVLFTYRSFF